MVLWKEQAWPLRVSAVITWMSWEMKKVGLSPHSLYLNMLDVFMVKSCFVAIFLMEETFL